MDGVIAAKRKKPPKVFDHIEIHAGPAGQQIVQQHFTSDEHEPKSYTVGKPTRGATKARSVVYAPATEGIKIIRAQADPLARRKQPASSVADVPSWQKRGLFKPGFTQGPRLKSAKLFTKGKGS